MEPPPPPPEAPYGAPIPPAPAHPGTGGIGRSWLLLSGIGCGCIGTMALGAILALTILVIGPAFRAERTEGASAPTAAPTNTRVGTATTASTRQAVATSTPVAKTAEAPVATPLPPTSPPAPTVAAPIPTRTPVSPIARPREQPVLPEAVERLGVDGAMVGVLGLTTLDEDGKLVIDDLGQTIFGTEQRGVGAAFVLEEGPAEGSLSVAGVWVTRQGQRLTPLADPATLEVSSMDEGQPLLFRLTFRTGSIPAGDYAFGLFTVENGQLDRLVKRLDFTVE